MKKHKFPILLKVILAGLLVSFVASGTAVMLSYYNQVTTGKKRLIDNIDNTLNDVSYYYEADENHDSTIADLQTIREHVENYYNIRVGLDREKKLEDFDSFTEYEDYYKDADHWIFPVEGEIGLSKEMLEFRLKYRDLLNSLMDASISSAAAGAYVAFKNADNRLVFIADSRMHKLQVDIDYYQVPGTYYQLKDTDVFHDNENGKYSECVIYGRTARYYTVHTDDDANEEVAIFFIEYNTSSVLKDCNAVLRTELIVLGLTGVAIVLIYAVLSYFMFVKNINKLSKASSEISEKLNNKETITPNEIKIRSHDEMRDLANSLNVLQQAVYDYTNIIEREASERQKINAELAVASQIQLEALPSFNYDDKHISLRAFIKAAKEVGGDFYDYFYLDENRFVVLIADVSGKGIPASLFMMRSKATLKNLILSNDNLEDAVYKANNSLVHNNKENLFVTSFIGVIDIKKKEMTFVNCGHERPYIISKGEVIKLEGNSNFVVGELDDFTYRQEKVAFNDGDKLIMFTDGLNESINDKNEEFGYQRIVDGLTINKDKELQEIIDSTISNLNTFTGEKDAFDDVTIIALSLNKPSLSLSYDKKDYSIIEDATNRFMDKFSYLPIKIQSEVGIIIDELLNNLISYDENENLIIDLEFEVKKDNLIIKIISNGGDYDPFANHVDKYLEEEKDMDTVGGFGVKLVKDFVDSYNYEYKNNHSIVTLTKKI